jgi:putative tricarboxylic transport membrane protein
MKKCQLCGAVFWVLLSVFVLLYAYRLGIGSFTNPGPGLFPFCLGLIMFIIAGILLTQILIKTGVHKTEKDEQPANFLKVIVVLAVLFAYAFLLENLGFLLTTFAVLAVLFRIGAYNNISTIL